jgi:NAD+ kinase
MLHIQKSFPLPTLLGKEFALRPFRPDDDWSLRQHMDDERVARDVTNIPYPYTIDHARAWLSKMSDVVTPESTRVDFAIDIHHQVVGSVAFINVDGHKAQVSMWVSPNYWGQGLATRALQMLVEFGFEQLGLERIYAYHYTENPKSGRVLEKAGFRFEGTHVKEWMKVIDGIPRLFDSNYYSITRRHRQVKTVALTVARGDRYDHISIAPFLRAARDYGIERVISLPDFESPAPRVDLAVSLGGDGNMMRTVSYFSQIGVPTLGVNAGDLGFLTSADAIDTDRVVARIARGDFEIERRLALRFKFREKWYGPFANEVLVAHQTRGIAHVAVNVGEYPLFAAIPADGVLVASATGSTAYNASAGGPILTPESHSVVINALNTPRFNMRPVVSEVLATGGVLELKVVGSKRDEALAIAADSLYLPDGPKVGESVYVMRHPQSLLFATFGPEQYYAALKGKMGLIK